MFHLLDIENARVLRHMVKKKNKEGKKGWYINVDDDKFWTMIDENIASPESASAKEWKESLRKSLEFELDLEGFQEIIGRGY